MSDSGYSPERRGGSMHGRIFHLRELRYGFEEDRFSLRVDLFPPLNFPVLNVITELPTID